MKTTKRNRAEKPKSKGQIPRRCAVASGSVILLPIGLTSKIRDTANGFRTKREVADMLANYGLTYGMLADMSDGHPFEERDDCKLCRYASSPNNPVSNAVNGAAQQNGPSNGVAL